MEYKFIENLYQFDFDILLSKLELKDKKNFTLHETKKILLYITGKKFKKDIILSELKSLNNFNNDFKNCISKDNIRFLYDKYLKMNTYKDLSSAFNEFLTENNNDKKEINIEMFINRIKDIMPNLSDELLSQIFIYLSENKETINLNIIEKKINHNLLENN